MEASIFTEVMLPLALASIMFGMGLSLTIEDFTRLWKTPKPIVLGLIGQLILLPLLALVIGLLLELSTPLLIGLIILAACPGGTTSNLFSQLARANLALSVSLTAISTIICVFSTPFIIQYAVTTLAGESAPQFSLLNTAIGLFAITLIPVIIGITLRHFQTQWALRSEGYFRKFSLMFMIIMIVIITIEEHQLLWDSLGTTFVATFLLSISSMSMGLILARIFSLSYRDAMTLAIKVGIQNGTLAILITLSFLNEPTYSVIIGMYSLVMYLGPIILITVSKWWNKQKDSTTTSPVPN